MTSGGFQVTYSDLSEAARAYLAQAEAIQKALKAFESAANLPASAFGRLPGSAKMASEYQKFFSQVTKDMGKLEQSMASGAVTLAMNAATYQAADEQNQEAIAQIGTFR